MTARNEPAYASGVPALRRLRWWGAFRTLVTKEVRRFLRIWAQTLLPPVITTTLYLMIFGHLIGRRIGPMGGHEYIAFIVPGLVMLSVITNAYGNVVSSFFAAKMQGFVQELLVAPIPNWLILAGYVAGSVVRALLTAVLVSAVAFALVDFSIAHLGLTVLFAVITAVLFALAGFINAVFANSFDHISIVPTFVLTPLTYLGGVFYSVDLLPPLWRTLSLANPVLYLVDGFRYAILGSSDIPVLNGLALLLVLTTALGGWALWLMQRGVGIKA
ncbi:MAG: ABC transporter permease [Immundisolibacter sp.]|uniref:ABC transporter permease n=1 Tax=Immundisolibacter sp. TaxID=1934948 RepID=UPI003EE25570